MVVNFRTNYGKSVLVGSFWARAPEYPTLPPTEPSQQATYSKMKFKTSSEQA